MSFIDSWKCSCKDGQYNSFKTFGWLLSTTRTFLCYIVESETKRSQELCLKPEYVVTSLYEKQRIIHTSTICIMYYRSEVQTYDNDSFCCRVESSQEVRQNSTTLSFSGSSRLTSILYQQDEGNNQYTVLLPILPLFYRMVIKFMITKGFSLVKVSTSGSCYVQTPRRIYICNVGCMKNFIERIKNNKSSSLFLKL